MAAERQRSGGRRTRSSSRGSSPSATASSRSRSRCWSSTSGSTKGLTEGQIANALWDQRDNFLAYAISFAVIGRFWLVHHRFFSEVTAFDGRLIGLNIVYLGWIVLIPFSSELLGEYGGDDDGGRLLRGQPRGRRPDRAADERRRPPPRPDRDRRPHPPRKPGPRRLHRRRSSCSRSRSPSSAPDIAPYLWLVLFFDPLASRLARAALSGLDGEGDRAARAWSS